MCRCAATAKRRVRFLGARAKFNPVIQQKAEGFKCQSTVAPHQLLSTRLPLITNSGREEDRCTHVHSNANSRHRTEERILKTREAGIFVPLYPDHNCPVWSFLRPTLISSLTSASMKEGTATSPLACLGRMTKLATRTGTP